MIRYALAAALLASLALAGMLYRETTLRADAEAESAALSRSVEALEAQAVESAKARRVEAARAEAWRARSEQLSETIEQLRGIPDAPLDPAIIDLLDRLRAGGR